MRTDLPMSRVESVSITHLFGLYDHVLTLNRDSRVSILHGPNGVGKSVLLRLIAAFFGGRYQEFFATPFDFFVLQLSDGTRVKIHGAGEQKPALLTSLRVDISGGGRSPSTVELRAVVNYDKAASEIARVSPYVSEMSGGQFFDHRTGQTATAQEIISRHGTPNDEALSIGVSKEAESPDLRAI